MIAAENDAGSPRVTVVVNDEAVEVRTWSRWRDAITTWRPEAGAALSKGKGVLLDASGEPVDPDGTIVPDCRITFQRTRDV